MDLIDEVIGYARANAEAARMPDERQTWEAHQRNCVRVSAEIARLRAEVERLGALWIRETRENERLKLLVYAPLGDNHHNALDCPYCQQRASEDGPR